MPWDTTVTYLGSPVEEVMIENMWTMGKVFLRYKSGLLEGKKGIGRLLYPREMRDMTRLGM